MTTTRRIALALTLPLFAVSGLAQSKTPGASTPRSNAAKTAPATSTASKPWERIAIPRLPAFNPQQPKRIELSNGMVIFLQEDHELPLINASIRIRGGSRLEPAEKTGLVSLYGQTWRTGGTTSKTGDELDDFLEARAARVETAGGLDSTSLSWSCLKADFDDVFKVAVDVLQNPAFRGDKIELAKRQTSTAISRRNDNPESIAARETNKLGYGAESPYARTVEYYTVAAVTREDFVRWHKQYVHPNNMILGIAGDFDSAAMESKLRAAFESLPKGPQAERKVDVPIAPAKPGIYFIQKDDVNQSVVRMVHLGIKRDNPDYYAVSVMNEVLGGGFSGRLMSNLRTKLGLAYSVGGGIGASYDHPGLFSLAMETKSGTTAAAIEGLNAQLDGLDKNPASDVELKRAKDTILNSFIFEFDDKEKVMAERMVYEYFGYPADFLERFRAGIEKVTADDVARVARKYVHKNQLAVLVLGNATDFDRQLSTFGEVHKIDITIPEAAPGKPAATSAPQKSNAAGQALIAKVVQGLGGAAKLRSVTSVRQSLTSVRKTAQGDIPLQIDQTVVFPDRIHATMTTPMGEMTTVITPQTATMTMGEQQQKLPQPVHEENLNNLKRDLVYVAQHAADASFTFTSAGSEKIGDTQTEILDVVAGGPATRWHVDAATGHVLRAQFRTLGAQGPADRVINYSDWRDAGGLSLPFKRTISEDGEVVSDDTFKSIELNPQIDPKLFQ